MINTTHLKVLLKKDFLSLWRNKGFLVAFIILPIGLMSAFIGIQSLVDQGPKSGNMIYDHFRFTFNLELLPIPPESFFGYPLFKTGASGTPNPSPSWATILRQCAAPNQAKYNYTKLAIVADDENVRKAAGEYFSSAFMANSGLEFFLTVAGRADDAKDFISTHKDYSEVGDSVTNENDQPYCLAIVFEKFDEDDYEVALRYPVKSLPDSTNPPYNALIKAPDFSSYDKWFSSGAPALYPYITEFIARYNTDGAVMADPKPSFVQQVGYSPMKTGEFEDVSPQGL